jgi:hypothetical protein
MLGLAKTIVSNNEVKPYILSDYSIQFDGVGDFLSFTEKSFAIDDAGDDLTIAFWCKRDSDDGDASCIFGNSATASLKRIHFDPEGDALFIESDQNGESYEGVVTADTNWHHYAITMEGNDGGPATVAMYEDGAAVEGENTNFGNVNDKNFTVNRIGSDAGTGTTELKGFLYQVAIWNKALTLGEVAEIYNSGNPIIIEGFLDDYQSANRLLHLWDFSEGSGSTTEDLIGDLTATLTGNAAFSSTTP